MFCVRVCLCVYVCTCGECMYALLKKEVENGNGYNVDGKQTAVHFSIFIWSMGFCHFGWIKNQIGNKRAKQIMFKFNGAEYENWIEETSSFQMNKLKKKPKNRRKSSWIIK